MAAVAKVFMLAIFDDPRSPNPSQARALEKVGCEVVRYSYRERAARLGRERRDDEIIALCARERPDFVLFSKCNQVDHRVVEACNEASRTILWYMDWTHHFDAELVEKIKRCSLVVCSRWGAYERAKAVNHRTIRLAEGFDPAVDRPFQVSTRAMEVEKRCDVSFIGSLDGDGCHFDRAGYQRELGFAVFNDVFGRDHARVVAASRINLNFTEGDGTSDRTYKVLASRGFLLTQPWENMEREFTPGEHLDTFTNVEELREKIAFYLSHANLRRRIAASGCRAVQRFSRVEWARELLEFAGVDVAGGCVSRKHAWNTTKSLESA